MRSCARSPGQRRGGRTSEADLHAALGTLTNGDLLYVRGVPPAATYIFKHALVQDSAYASLLKSRRRALHAAIAAVLTEQFPDVVEAQPELMAHHYAETGDIAQAVTHYQRAGERTAQRSANLWFSRATSRGRCSISSTASNCTYDFACFLRRRAQEERFDGLLLSESALSKDWNAPEEDAAWGSL